MDALHGVALFERPAGVIRSRSLQLPGVRPGTARGTRTLVRFRQLPARPHRTRRSAERVTGTMQTRVRRRRTLTGLPEPDTVEAGTIRTKSAALSLIPSMTADHHGHAVCLTSAPLGQIEVIA